MTILYAFGCGADGFTPSGGVVMDQAGDLFGAAYGGGSINEGNVFKLTPDGVESVFHSFVGHGDDGAYPVAGLIMDKKGNLFGTTYGGGAADLGTVFKIKPDGTETVLYSFKGGSDGASPFASLAADTSGNLYGTTWGGGGAGCNGNGCGTVFKVTRGGTETVLHSFAGGSDGFGPYGGVVVDKDGNVYGSTSYGGGSGCSGNGCGIIFKLTPDGTKSDLHVFSGDDGARPSANLIADKKYNLYGSTFDGGGSGCGGGGCGVVFKIKQ
ncbi:MAG: choice-of-anchor tandem repeat GloVer-containing protein [Alphaproteobacteria bacterium]